MSRSPACQSCHSFSRRVTLVGTLIHPQGWVRSTEAWASCQTAPCHDTIVNLENEGKLLSCQYRYYTSNGSFAQIFSQTRFKDSGNVVDFTMEITNTRGCRPEIRWLKGLVKAHSLTLEASYHGGDIVTVCQVIDWECVPEAGESEDDLFRSPDRRGLVSGRSAGD